jgi:hypothetical protein
MEPTSKSEWPAFPAMHYDLAEHEHGMTLRDYFAAKAMQAAITGCATKGEVGLYSDWAGFAYEMADAMMEARNATQ